MTNLTIQQLLQNENMERAEGIKAAKRIARENNKTYYITKTSTGWNLSQNYPLWFTGGHVEIDNKGNIRDITKEEIDRLNEPDKKPKTRRKSTRIVRGRL